MLDAERMDLEGDSVDGVGCRYGYMLMADPAAALRETRRVLRDGGRLAFAVWSTPERNPWVAIPAMTLVQRGHVPPPEPGAPGVFALGHARAYPRAGQRGGLPGPGDRGDPVRLPLRRRRRRVGHALGLAGSIARTVSGLPDDEREATRAAILENLATYRNDDGSYSTPASSWGVLTR